MTERPIIMSAESVLAILYGRKTQTRRVLKLQPTGADYWSYQEGAFYPNKKAVPNFLKCPYEIGMKLWVRETWRVVGWSEGNPLSIEYKADNQILEEPGDSSTYDLDKYCQLYIDCTDDCDKASIAVDENGKYNIPLDSYPPTRWRSPIFMPRWASRITLEIVNVRVERLQEISEEDAMAEGVPGIATSIPYPKQYRDSFEVIWDAISAKRGYPWASNPWVWIVEFKVLP